MTVSKIEAASSHFGAEFNGKTETEVDKEVDT